MRWGVVWLYAIKQVGGAHDRQWMWSIHQCSQAHGPGLRPAATQAQQQDSAELPFTLSFLQTIDYAPQMDAPAAALLTEEELAVCTTSHKPRQLAAFKMQHLLAEAEPHVPHAVVRACVRPVQACKASRNELHVASCCV